MLTARPAAAIASIGTPITGAGSMMRPAASTMIHTTTPIITMPFAKAARISARA